MTTQPDNFGFGEDEAMLRDSARKFFADNMSADKLHKLVAHDYDPERENACAWDQDLWQQLVELGWTAACVPERAGGIGMPLVAAVALAEEAGRAAFPSPLLSTFMATAVLSACETPAADKALEGIASAARRSRLAITNSCRQPGGWRILTSAVHVDGSLSGTACLRAGCAQGRSVRGQRQRRRMVWVFTW